MKINVYRTYKLWHPHVYAVSFDSSEYVPLTYRYQNDFNFACFLLFSTFFFCTANIFLWPFALISNTFCMKSLCSSFRLLYRLGIPASNALFQSPDRLSSCRIVSIDGRGSLLLLPVPHLQYYKIYSISQS